MLFAAAGCSNPEAKKQRLVESGDQYLAQNKVPEAAIQYRNAVQLDPTSGPIRRGSPRRT